MALRTKVCKTAFLCKLVRAFLLADNSIAQMNRANIDPVDYIDKDDYLLMTGLKKPTGKSITTILVY